MYLSVDTPEDPFVAELRKDDIRAAYQRLREDLTAGRATVKQAADRHAALSTMLGIWDALRLYGDPRWPDDGLRTQLTPITAERWARYLS